MGTKGDLPNADEQSNYTLLFQPVFPFTLQPTASGGKANLLIRPGIPIMFDQPVFDVRKADFDEVTAMGDIGFDVAYGVTEKSGAKIVLDRDKADKELDGILNTYKVSSDRLLPPD